MSKLQSKAIKGSMAIIVAVILAPLLTFTVLIGYSNWHEPPKQEYCITNELGKPDWTAVGKDDWLENGHTDLCVDSGKLVHFVPDWFRKPHIWKPAIKGKKGLYIIRDMPYNEDNTPMDSLILKGTAYTIGKKEFVMYSVHYPVEKTYEWVAYDYYARGTYNCSWKNDIKKLKRGFVGLLYDYQKPSSRQYKVTGEYQEYNPITGQQDIYEFSKELSAWELVELSEYPVHLNEDYFIDID